MAAPERPGVPAAARLRRAGPGAQLGAPGALPHGALQGRCGDAGAGAGGGRSTGPWGWRLQQPEWFCPRSRGGPGLLNGALVPLPARQAMHAWVSLSSHQPPPAFCVHDSWLGYQVARACAYALCYWRCPPPLLLPPPPPLPRLLQMVDENPFVIPPVDETKWFTGSHLGTQIQSCNWQVCNITTPANYFHVLRRQVGGWVGGRTGGPAWPGGEGCGGAGSPPAPQLRAGVPCRRGCWCHSPS